MNGASSERFLIQQGLLMFLVGLVLGAFTQAVANPRMMLGAHTGALLAGTFLVALGAVWHQIVLSQRFERATLLALVGGSWGISVALVFASMFATSRSTPILGAGHSGAAWAELFADVLLTVSSVAVVVAAAVIVRAAFTTRTIGQD